MPSSDSIPRRAAAAASVTLGLVLLGASANGVMALDGRLEAANDHTVPARLTDGLMPSERQRRCHRPHLGEPRPPEV